LPLQFAKSQSIFLRVPHRRSRDAQGHDALDVNKDGVVDSNDAADAAKKLKAGCTPTNCAVM
jgi:hypothetical protein